MVLYKLENLIDNDQFLQKATENPPSEDALINTQQDYNKAQRLQFIWALSPYFTWYCLHNLETPDILYIDSDIYFFNDWRKLYENLNNTSIGLVEHRCYTNNGKYNVGIVYFKKDTDGCECSTWWKNCLLSTNHRFYKTHGICGDQKYLELFEKFFNNVSIFDEHIGHLAPWNFNMHEYNKDDTITWQGKTQDVLYCHFSGFKPDYLNDSFKSAQRHGYETITHPFLSKIYQQYFETLKRVRC